MGYCPLYFPLMPFSPIISPMSLSHPPSSPTGHLCTGLMASLLGIGGGMVIGPLLLEIGMHPVVSSSTTACMTLFTASSATLQYLVGNTDTFDYFLFYVAISFCAGLLGRKFIQAYLERTGKQAAVVMLLAMIITLALCVMAYVTIGRVVDNVTNNVAFSFQDLCPLVGPILNTGNATK